MPGSCSAGGIILLVGVLFPDHFFQVFLRLWIRCSFLTGARISIWDPPSA